MNVICQRMLMDPLSVLVGEIVSNSPLGKDEFRLRSVSFNLFTQTADVDIDCAGIAHIVVLPDGLQHGFTAEHFAAVVDEQLQQVELLGGQTNLLAVKRNGTVDDVDLEIADADDLFFFGQSRLTGTAQNGFDAGFDLQDVERLGNIVIGTIFKSENFVHVFAFGCQHDNRNVAGLANALTDLRTVHLGQHQIQQYKIDMVIEEQIKRLFAIIGGEGLVAILFQIIFETLDHQGFVINEQNPFAHAAQSFRDMQLIHYYFTTNISFNQVG